MTQDDVLLRPRREDLETRSPIDAMRLLMGGPVVLVTVAWSGHANVMPLAWHIPLSHDPPLLGIAIGQSRHTMDMVQHAQCFALNFPPRPLVHHVQYIGALHGDEIDKFEATQLETFSATHVTAPLIESCVAWVECEVEDIHPFGDHELVIARPAGVLVDPRAFNGQWLVTPENESQRPLQYLGGNAYSTLQSLIEARVPRDFEAPEAVLRERLAEELELTRDAQEARAERLDRLQREIDAGNVVDVSELEQDAPADPLGGIDLSRGVILGEPDD